MSERVVISVHIEKTGGTSFQALLVELFDPENVLLYRAPTGKFYRAADLNDPRITPWGDYIKRELRRFPWLVPLLAKIDAWQLARIRGYSLEDLPALKPRVVHGHFSADQLEGVFTHPFWVVIFREPLARLQSLYQHLSDNKGITNFRVQPSAWPVSFETFVLDANLRNSQTAALGGKSLKDFNLVGVTRYLGAFFNGFQQIIFGRVLEPNPPHLNSSPRQVSLEQLGVTDTIEFLEVVRAAHSLDYANYQIALRLSPK